MRERSVKIHAMLARACAGALLALIAACAAPPPTRPVVPGSTPPAPAAAEAPKAPVPATVYPRAMPGPIASDSAPKQTPAPAGPPPGVSFRPASWDDLPGWRDDPISEAWSAFNASCGPLANREAWREICATVSGMPNPSSDVARRFFERAFTPWLVTSGDGADEGLITGYYEPLLRGSRRPNGRYRFPLYRVPDDLLVVDLSDVYPELKGLRLRGKLDGRRVVPYYERSQIETGHAPLRGKELVWVDDAIDLFFLHIQGSGRILLESGQTIRVGYADQNGYPYRSIGRLLVERGELALEQASMEGIKSWARSHPEQIAPLLNSNGSYVFFRELPSQGKGPPGSLGVPLSPGRSIAVDARFIPLGAPVYIATTWPNSIRPLHRLALAQDTGGAIRGAVRADLFWGHGDGAAREAGRMKQRLRMWVLLPVGSVPQNQLTAD